MDRTNDVVEALIAPLFKPEARREYGVPAIFAPSYDGDRLQERLTHSTDRARFEAIRAEADLFLVHHVKHLWTPSSVQKFDIYQEKGNDQVFHALKMLKERRPDLRIRIMMCDYGPDAEISRTLARELGVEDCVVWIPLTPRKEIMIAISMADAVIGEIARSWLTYGTIIEAMVMRKPVIHNRNDAFFGDRPLYPMYHASNAEEIAQAMTQLVDNPDEARAIGAGGRDWYDQETIAPMISEILALSSNKINIPHPS